MNIDTLEDKVMDLIEKYDKKYQGLQDRYGAVIVLKGDDVTAEEAIGYADWCSYSKAGVALGQVLDIIEELK
tara:strand:+ start:398 stop:613 length:216 start_codon:yes stop_codon:yes gene_type:complete